MDNQQCLFEQLPSELNVFIIRMLDTHTVIRTSTTCKRWLNNAKCVTDLDILVTSKNEKPISTEEPPIDWNAVGCTLKKFSPAKIRSLALELRPNPLYSTFPVAKHFIRKLTRLESLTISSCLISPFYISCRQMTELHVLGIIPCRDDFADCVKGLTNLEKLSFQMGNHFVHSLDFGFVRWGGLPNCTWLKIRDGNASWNMYMGLMTQLKHLYMENAYIDDHRFDQFTTLTNLEVLSLAGLKSQAPLSNSEKKFYLDRPPRNSNPHPISGLRHLTTLRSLTYLDISEIREPISMQESDTYSSEFDVAEYLRHWPNLKTINLTGTNIGEANEEKRRDIEGLTIEKQNWTV